jgi:exonuclease VII large subunit
VDNKSVFDVISVIASIASLILAVGAIWLSVVFYRMSSEASKATTEAAKGIASSVERLENLFDKLYSDTFSMMRDTVSDMRKHIWPADDKEQETAAEEVEKKADEKIAELKSVMEKQVGEMLNRQRLADEKTTALRSEMRHILDRAILSSREAELEAREETVREHILRVLRIFRRVRPRSTVDELVERLRRSFPISRIVSELEKLRDEGIIDVSPREIAPHSEIRLRPTAVGRLRDADAPDSKA